jgi:hypothetical protein
MAYLHLGSGRVTVGPDKFDFSHLDPLLHIEK